LFRQSALSAFFSCLCIIWQIVETNNVLMAEMQRCRTENVALKAQVEAQRTEIARLNELLAQRDD